MARRCTMLARHHLCHQNYVAANAAVFGERWFLANDCAEVFR